MGSTPPLPRSSQKIHRIMDIFATLRCTLNIKRHCCSYSASSLLFFCTEVNHLMQSLMISFPYHACFNLFCLRKEGISRRWICRPTRCIPPCFVVLTTKQSSCVKYRPPCTNILRWERFIPDPGTPPGGYLTRVPPRGPGTPRGGYLTQVPPRGGSGYPPGGVPDPVPPWGGTWPGYPLGGYLTQSPPGGVPDLGTPLGGYLTRVTPPGGRYLTRVPPRGYLTGPPPCGQTNTCENSTFPSYYVHGR